LKRLTDPRVREQMTLSMKSEGFAKDMGVGPGAHQLCAGKAEYQGRYVAELSRDQGKSPHQWLFDALSKPDCAPTWSPS